MESNRVSVKIYGQEYVIAGEKSREHIIKVADYVDTKMHEIAMAVNGGPVSALAVLSAVNVADEYFDQVEELERQRTRNSQMEKDTEHYIQLWDEAKKNFVQYKEDAGVILQQKEELQRLLADKEQEIRSLKEKASSAEKAVKEESENKLTELQAKCKELENSFFDLQMENIQLKSEIERYKNAKNTF